MAVRVGISLLFFRYFILPIHFNHQVGWGTGLFVTKKIYRWFRHKCYLDHQVGLVHHCPHEQLSLIVLKALRKTLEENDIFCVISSTGRDWLSREVPCTFFLCGHLAIDINCTPIALTEGTKSLPFSPPIYFNIVSFKVEFSLGSLHKLIWSKVISSLNPLLLVQ